MRPRRGRMSCMALRCGADQHDESLNDVKSERMEPKDVAVKEADTVLIRTHGSTSENRM
jgi:hypothetical protein